MKRETSYPVGRGVTYNYMSYMGIPQWVWFLFWPFWSEIGYRFPQISYGFCNLLDTLGLGMYILEEATFFCHLFQSRRPAIKALHKAFNIHLSLGTNYTEGLKPGID